MDEKQKQKLLEKRQVTIAVQELFASPKGKLVLQKLSEMCNENKPTYVDQNPNGSAYKEGQRSIILGIRNIMNKKEEPKQRKADL